MRVMKCRSVCPKCNEQCLGVQGHNKEVEHQCVGHHFWVVGDINNKELRNAVCNRKRVQDGFGEAIKGKLL